MAALTVPLQLRWSDLDAYGHVNNVAIVGLLEQARVLAFWSDEDPILPPLTASASVWVLVADVHVKYRRPIDHRTGPIEAQVSVSRIAGASFVIDYALIVDGVVCAAASTTMALVDGASGTPVRVSPELAERLRGFSA